MKISTKIIVASVLLSSIGILTAGALIGWQSSSIASQALEKRVFSQLVAIREGQKRQIEDYFKTIESQVVSFSNDIMVMEAMADFSKSFHSFDQEFELQNNDAIANYYQNEFGVLFKEKNPGDNSRAIEKLDQLNQNSKSLQHAYISLNPNPLGNKNLMNDSGDGSQYSQFHKKYHSHFDVYLNSFGYYDIFLVEPESGYIVYSVFKELDYATSLLSGPYQNSGLAAAFRKANSFTDEKAHVLIDFSPYYPSYNAAAAFIASPIFNDEGQKLGVLIFQMPIDRINDVMTYDKKWRDVGLGESGETYLIGDDNLLRSQSRFLMEDKNSYIAALKQSGIDSRIIDKIDASDSAIGLQPVNSTGARQAISGQVGIKSIKDYRNIDVLSAYSPLDIAGVNWAILSEMDVAEAMQDKEAMNTRILGILFLILVALLPIAFSTAYFVGRGISTPINSFINQVNNLVKDKNLTTRIHYDGQDELAFLAKSLNGLLAELQGVFNSVSSLAQTIHNATENMSVNMKETTQETTTQSDSADGVAVATNQLLATIQEVARSASNAADTVTETNCKCQDCMGSANELEHDMEELNNQMGSASSSIERLADESNSIGSVLDVIQGIAEQTNLLALNAAIEAARAGEMGRGFAVVADEVRTLASRTQQSTEDIREKIMALQQETQNTVKMVTASSKMASTGIGACESNREVMGEVVCLVEALNDMNNQIATASEQQSVVIEDINKNITEIADTSTKIKSKANESKDDVTQLNELAGNLEKRIEQFKL
ncbi:MAG: methyl-accepting chemotaxis protein [Litorilituus sp.]|jgi:methyl-accepting chemotaxis protein|nr:methyl-accepting chemotaxis protein [Litorilituus sp.]